MAQWRNFLSRVQKRMDGDEIRWRPPSVLFILLILCGGFIFYVDIFQLPTFNISSRIRVPQPRFVGYSMDSSKGYLVKTEGCRIPDMDPFDPSIVQYIFKEQHVTCNNDTPPLINSNLTYIYLMETSLSFYGVSDVSALKCCYSNFTRLDSSARESDDKIKINKQCTAFNNSASIAEEFIRVVCSYNGSDIYKDFFSFVPIKSKRNDSVPTKRDSSKLNVLVVGLDAVSRLNLHRHMPKTIRTLEEMQAVEFFGYNKVADNTFPNLVPVLTGLHENELVKKCWKRKEDKFDNCNFLWNNFSNEGFRTAFGEDSAFIGLFNYVKRGFKKQPTDYYWDAFDLTAERTIGNEHRMNVYQCIGSRLVYRSFLEYIDKFAKIMATNDLAYFGFFWGSSLSHDYLNKPGLGDEDYANFFKGLWESGTLTNTVLIFMSDHGIRWGDIRTTYQGRMEERLPFLFLALPKSYRENYYHTYINLRRNTKQLTTPFDLHETLKDLLYPYNLTKETLNKRIERRTNQRGYSLFEPIPNNRTCKDAGIASHWCTCQKSTNIAKDDQIVVEAAKYTILYINNLLVGYASCANLSLMDVLNARVHSSHKDLLGDKNFYLDYTIAFRTTPGDATFEVTVRRVMNKSKKSYSFNITGTISRINLYGKQSMCITDFHLKLYCYCKT